ncbi:MAG: hypothetical protein F4179_11020 [Gammaproteobacteria bacterium]|nr:hypothetical protein [Gammaproteobacteria bacterium]MYF62182.1 hypothetical protein [Gammaproteobacteria bacterium]
MVNSAIPAFNLTAPASSSSTETSGLSFNCPSTQLMTSASVVVLPFAGAGAGAGAGASAGAAAASAAASEAASAAAAAAAALLARRFT